MNEETVNQGLKVAEGITNYGMTTVTSAFFLVLCFILAGVMVWFFKKSLNTFYKNFENLPTTLALIEESMNENTRNYAAILSVNQNIELYLRNLSDVAITNHISTLKLIINDNFKLTEERVVVIIMDIKLQNHIHENKQLIETKLKRILKNIYAQREAYFSNFKYNGHTLDFYLNDNCITEVYKVALAEIYSDHKEGLIRSNIRTVYDEVKNDFFKRLNN